MHNWKENFEKGKEVTLVSSSLNGIPNANIAISLGFVDNRILLYDCQMLKTISNLKSNPNICLVSGYLRISGDVEIFDKGEHFDTCVRENEGSDYAPKNALLINIKEVVDLDSSNLIYPK